MVCSSRKCVRMIGKEASREVHSEFGGTCGLDRTRAVRLISEGLALFCFSPDLAGLGHKHLILDSKDIYSPTRQNSLIKRAAILHFVDLSEYLAEKFQGDSEKFLRGMYGSFADESFVSRCASRKLNEGCLNEGIAYLFLDEMSGINVQKRIYAGLIETQAVIG